MSQDLPSFDLVVATVGRVEQLERLLDSLEAQKYPRLRVIAVDQSGDDLAAKAFAGRDLEFRHLRSERGLSRARNTGLAQVRADLVAFPDDDCVYPPGLMTSVAERLSHEPGLSGLSGRVEDRFGLSSPSWKTDSTMLSVDNLWNRANAAAIFLRREIVERVGAFDERLGLGSREPWSSGEEIDYLIRALRAGARIEYDPRIVVRHDVRVDDVPTGFRDGASVGYLLRKHHYPKRVLGRMLVRPVGGIGLSLLRMDTKRARFHAATLRGRLRGLRSSRVSAS